MKTDWTWIVTAICATVTALGITYGIVSYNIDRNEKRAEICKVAIENDEPLVCQAFMGMIR